MTEPSPQPDPEHLSEQETIDENQAVGSDLDFSIASDAPSVPAELVAHPRYEVLQAIGQGGMGSVYKARHRLMDRLVAIKVIKPELIRNVRTIQRFQREAKAAARLTHPNIVTAFDAEHLGELHLLVMEYVDGTDLAELVKKRGPLSISDACTCVVQIAAGLQHAYENGMVHRDIKPQNLILMSQPKDYQRDDSSICLVGTVKILDFGLASFAIPDDSDEGKLAADHNITAIGTFMGTPDYVAPEQAQDARRADIRSDLYSLGATLRFLLCGRPLRWQKEANTDQPRADAREDVMDQPQLPDSLQGIIKRMMSPDPKDRFQTPSEVIEALNSFITTDPKTLLPSRHAHGTSAAIKKTACLKRLLLAAATSSAIGLLLLALLWHFDTSKIRLGVLRATQSDEASISAMPEVNPKDIWDDAIEKIDLNRDGINGQWRIETDRLLTPDFERGLRAVLELPVDVPAEYSLELLVSRRSDANERFGGLNIAFPFGDSRGMLAIGTHRDVGGCFIERIDGIARHESLPTWTEGIFFELNEPRFINLNVRNKEIVVLIDDTEAIRWSGDPNQIELPPGWEIPDRHSVFLGATGEFVIEKILFAPVVTEIRPRD
ncbi:serine/threonine protein kinase [Rhodopirellula europaea]|uniref:serine/threonine protein kinase n=1 Tax=Rhodopirellula europaea TaxID=1263866 RepID=UPI003D2BC179